MREVITRLKDTGDFEIVVFDDETILHEPIENWPVVQAMIAFYSEQEDVCFPLHKVHPAPSCIQICGSILSKVLASACIQVNDGCPTSS